MKPPFSVLIVHGDGTRILRVNLPRWLAYGTMGLFAALAVSAFALSGEHALLVQQWAQMAALRRRVADQRHLIDSFQTRVASVRGEIAHWKAAHARMWEAFGPEAGADVKTGIGGGTPMPESATAGVKRPAEELEMLASAVAEEGPRLEELEHVVTRTGKLMSRLPLRWPLHGHVRSEFGVRPSPWTGDPERHLGIDIGSPPGTPVRSPAPGTVLVASTGGDFGKKVMIDHGNGVRSLYGHLKKIEVKSGQKVEKGQVIGLVGSTGRSTGPHLHYQVIVQGKPVNPRGFLWER
jgi:septal ring factor EnvC (AmiA/AmiB activator)